jgi:hypothetical protein
MGTQSWEHSAPLNAASLNSVGGTTACDQKTSVLGAASTLAKKVTIQVYLDDGRVYTYDVGNTDKAREHATAIIQGGYRHNDGTVFEHYPPHRILKVKVDAAVPTRYVDSATGT